MTARTRTLALFVAVGTAALLGVLTPVAGAQDAKPTVAVTGVDTSSGTVTLTNHGDAEVDPNGLVMCSFPDYAPLEGADVIAPGESITVEATVPVGAESGELGIYTGGPFDDADNIVAYVEWGEPGHMRAVTAIAAGVWSEGAAEATDGVITASVDNPTSPADWGATAAADASEATESAEAPAETETEVAAESELALTGGETWVLAIIGAGLLFIGGMTVAEGRRGTRG